MLDAGRVGVVGALAVVIGAPGASATDGDCEQEIWVGGWFSHNVLRIDWQTGALIDVFIPPQGGGILEPHDYSFGPDGNFYVASHGNSSVRRFDGKDGTFIDTFVAPENDLSRSHSVFWKAPAGSGDPTLLVASELTHRVNEYDQDGRFLGHFVMPNEAGLIGPEFIVEGPDGSLYLTGQSNQVLKLDRAEGGVSEVFVGAPGDTGGLNWAHQLVFGPDGHLYVASSQSSAILRYDGATGEFLGAFVPSGSGGLAFPVGLAFGPDGHLYVASFSNSRILRYDGGTGAFLAIVSNLGALGLSGPLGLRFFTGPIAADCNGNRISDECDIAAGTSLDGNRNGVPDECEGGPDVNGDGVVDVGDLVEVILSWGPCPPPPETCPADVDGNGTVDVDDLVAVIVGWG